MSVEDYQDREIARQAVELQRIRDEMRNPVPPMTPLNIFEEVRRTQGERIGQLEELVRTINGKIWTALVFPIIVIIAAAVLLSLFGVHR